jgi:hypothetical protein
MLCAALVLLWTDQVRLAKLLSIGRRMKSHRLTDVTGMIDEPIERYVAAADASASALDAGLLLLEPSVRQLRQSV